jgi:outer membrane protein OmpA-like peptidoglycan-associated protein
VKDHHYQLLHLSRRVAGSQTQFGLLVARKLQLQSTTTPPQYSHDTCAFTVLFSPRRFKLTKAAKQAIKKSAQCMKENPGQPIHVVGHTDQRIFSNYGKKDNNAKLGLRRALSVMDALVEAGIEPDRIATVSSKGSSKPTVSGMDRAAYRENRRVEVHSDPTL